MIYWGGVILVDNYKCVCGLINLCVDLSYGCNCDVNDYVWWEDSGFFNEKFDLLVLMLMFGDSGGFYERGYYMFGKFKCYGNVWMVFDFEMFRCY